MMTLRKFAAKPGMIPQMTVWYLGDLREARGKQELYTRQSPQRLKALREHALIESAVSSNRIEGVTVNASRVATLMFGKPLLKDRDEQEVRGYRDALKLIHEKSARTRLNEATVRLLHRLSRGGAGDAGRYKTGENDIIERYADGRQRVRFRTARASKTPAFLKESVGLWRTALDEHSAEPLLLLGAFNLDFLCIHPFRDGNGRVSRLLLLLQCYHLGYEVGRYISLERLIEENKDRYYETLEQSSHGWHEGKHDPWPYINYLLFILKTAYKEFEQRAGQISDLKGAKAEIVREAIRRQGDEFKLAEIERACPAVSREWIRTLLMQMKSSGEVTCRGKGPAARWRFHGSKGTTLK